MKTNSSRLRSVSAAPKLAMTRMMTALLRRRSGPKSSASTRSARPAVGGSGDDGGDRAATSRRRRGRSAWRGRRRASRGAPLSAERDVGAPGEEVAMGEVGEAQDRIGERDADGAEADHRPEDQAVEEDLRAHDARLRAAGAEIELADERVVGERRGRALVGDPALDEDHGAVGDGESGAHVLLDEHDGDAGAVDRLQAVEDLADDLRRQAGRGLVEDQDRGLDDQRAGDGKHLALAAGERAGAGAGARGEVGEHAVERGDPPGAARLRQDSARRAGGSRGWSASRRCSRSAARRRGRAAPSRVRGAAVISAPCEADRAGMHRDEAGDRLDEGRLAGAVRAEQHDELARGDDEVDAAHDRQVALVAGDERARLERRRSRGDRPR